MGGRYLLTGIQLGMLTARAAQGPDKSDVVDIVDHILEKQSIGDSEVPVEEEAKAMLKEREE